MGIPVVPMVTNGYLPIYVGFGKKEIHAAYMGPMSYAELCEYAPSEPAVMELRPGGRAGYHAILIARSGGGIERLEDGEGKIMGMVSEHSTSGFLIPTLHFFAALKTSPGAFASKVDFAGTHDDVSKGVAEGKYDLGATNDIDLERACNEQGFKREQFVILWKSELYPASPYAVRKDLPESLRKAYREGMLAAGSRADIRSDVGVGGFIAVEDSIYDSVRALRNMMK
jgi:phosphonate transport system substrate-binding protein